ncbi:MAG: hypothetical protein HPY44_02410 [Armatimonadetes bacterium]|nr:hypothetical protein [Armatimonadota bacterium]
MNAGLQRTATCFVITSGFVAGVAQVLLIRELLLSCFGNEISLGLMLSAWLVCGAAGVALACRWRSGPPALSASVLRAAKLAASLAPGLLLSLVYARTYQTLANAVPTWIALVAESIPLLARIIRVHLAAQPGEMLGPVHLGLISFGTALAPAMLCGALFAVGLRIYEQTRCGAGDSAGRAYALDAVGHLVGGVLLGAAVVTVLNPFAVCVAATSVLWAASGMLAGAAGVGSKRLAIGGLVAVLILAAACVPLQAVTTRIRWQGQELLGQVSSIYGHMAVARQGTSGLVFFQNGAPTGTSPAMPSVEEVVHFTLLQHPDPQRVLLIGGGATGGLAEVLKHKPERVTYAEIDPALLELAGRWLTGPDAAALRDPRVEKLIVDGRLLVKQAAHGVREKYDAIINLLPDPSTALLNRFYTQEWFREASLALNKGGVLGWRMSSSRHHFRESLRRLNRSIMQAATASFPSIAMMPGEDALTVVQGDDSAKLTETFAVMAQRMEERGVQADYFRIMAPDHLLRQNRDFVVAELAKGPMVRTNRDQVPVGYFYDQAVWLGFYFPGAEDVYVRIGGLRLSNLLAPGLVLLAALLAAGVWRSGRALYVPAAVLVTGALGMALELCILFAFQAYHGYVYRLAGLVIGAFMVGLASGAVLAARLMAARPEARSVAWWLAGSQLALGLVALGLPGVMAHIGENETLAVHLPTLAVGVFAGLTGLVGFVVGVQFPLATRTARDARGAVEDAENGQARSAATLYAADLVGAALGAATLGAVLIPVLGIPQTCIAAACASGGMALALGLRAWFVR